MPRRTEDSGRCCSSSAPRSLAPSRSSTNRPQRRGRDSAGESRGSTRHHAGMVWLADSSAQTLTRGGSAEAVAQRAAVKRRATASQAHCHRTAGPGLHVSMPAEHCAESSCNRERPSRKSLLALRWHAGTWQARRPVSAGAWERALVAAHKDATNPGALSLRVKVPPNPRGSACTPATGTLGASTADGSSMANGRNLGPHTEPELVNLLALRLGRFSLGLHGPPEQPECPRG
jgi:hypothetical protein